MDSTVLHENPLLALLSVIQCIFLIIIRTYRHKLEIPQTLTRELSEGPECYSTHFFLRPNIFGGIRRGG